MPSRTVVVAAVTGIVSAAVTAGLFLTVLDRDDTPATTTGPVTAVTTPGTDDPNRVEVAGRVLVVDETAQIPAGVTDPTMCPYTLVAVFGGNPERVTAEGCSTVQFTSYLVDGSSTAVTVAAIRFGNRTAAEKAADTVKFVTFDERTAGRVFVVPNGDNYTELVAVAVRGSTEAGTILEEIAEPVAEQFIGRPVN